MAQVKKNAAAQKRNAAAPRNQAATAKPAAKAASKAGEREVVQVTKTAEHADGRVRARVPDAVVRDLGGVGGLQLKFTRERKGVWTLTASKGAAKKDR